MELLLLFLLTRTILVQGDGKSNDPNDEPFLPIYPVYPYSPKLMKRGTDRGTDRGADRETVTQLSPELYAPNVDAKDSYSASYTTNYPRDPYYPNYNPYPKVPSSTGYSYSYGAVPYSYTSTTPYNPYVPYSSLYPTAASSYVPIPYSSSYPNLYYHYPYYYPGHYSQSILPPSPPSPTQPSPPSPPSPIVQLASTDYPSDPYSSDEGATIDKNRDKDINMDERYKDSEINREATGNRFVDGGNYISGNSKDLDSQPSTYKASSSQNRLNQDSQIKNFPIPLPKTTYRVISVAGQPVGPDYPLPATYARAQQLQELFSQTWAKLLAQSLQRQNALHLEHETNKNIGSQGNDEKVDSQHLFTVPNVIAKPGLTYIVTPSIVRKLNAGQTSTQLIQTPVIRPQNVKYAPLTTRTYAAVEKLEKDRTESEDYDSYENPSSQGAQDYDTSSSQLEKQSQNYENDTDRIVTTKARQNHQNQNFVTVETPRRHNHPYSEYNPSQSITLQQAQQYKNNLDDATFGVKTKNA